MSNIVILLSVLWYVSGVTSFVWWWTKDFDFTLNLLPMPLLMGLVGPIAFLIGLIVQKDSESTILFSKRK